MGLFSHNMEWEGHRDERDVILRVATRGSCSTKRVASRADALPSCLPEDE